ncbi:MAG TPA: tetratricopeptide repeat protein [Chthoniobacterales bacterium]|jgi:TolA-binding protein|nr:tetratricopeptide repeat protein [Chthoniobacterales bacterium]
MPTASPPSTDAVVEAQVFWLRFQKEIAAALIIVILGIVGFAGYRFYTYRRNSTAAELLGNAKNPQDYQEVIARYPGTPAGASAYLVLAEKQRNEKRFSEANATLQAFVEKYPEHDFVPTARLAMAANLESMGKNDEALSIYQEVAAKYANTYNGPLALISEVPLLKAKNRIEDARRICEEILTKYRMPGQQAEIAGDNRMETVWAGEAMRQLRSLKPPEQPKPAPGAAAGLPARPPAQGAPPMIAAPSAPPSTGPVSAGAPTPKKP